MRTRECQLLSFKKTIELSHWRDKITSRKESKTWFSSILLKFSRWVPLNMMMWCERQNPATEFKTISRAGHYKHQQGNSSRCSEYFRSFIVAIINMRGGKPINMLNEPNSTYLLCQERHKNHIKFLSKRSEVKPMENNKQRKSTSYNLDMTLRMRRLVVTAQFSQHLKILQTKPATKTQEAKFDKRPR